LKRSAPHGSTKRSTEASPSTRPRPDRRTLIVATAAVVVAIAILVAGGWRFWVLLNADTEPTVDRAELQALQTKLAAVKGAITPIAVAFTSQSSTATIDLAAYRSRVEAARTVVSGVNDVRLSSPDAIEVRDMIITGGSQVLDGMDAALDALASDEASAADEASVTVEEGLATLDEAAARLQDLLGTTSST
jgi:hypothetical protein